MQNFRIFTKMCSPLEQETHFWKPTVSNPPSNIHFNGASKARDKDSLGHLLDIYRSFAQSVRLLSASVAHHNFDSRSRLVHFGTLKPHSQNDNIYHTCNFVTFWWLVPFSVCLWWLYTHFLQKCCLVWHSFCIFTKLCSPLERETHLWTQLWAIGLQKCIFCNPEGFRSGLNVPSFWHLSLFWPFSSSQFRFNCPPKLVALHWIFAFFGTCLTPQVAPKWCKRTPKWPQSDPKVAQSDPKTTQSDPNVTHSDPNMTPKSVLVHGGRLV